MFFLNNKKEIAVVLLWIMSISLIVIISYYSIYLSSEKWKTYNIAWHPTEGPTLNIFSMTLMFILSMLVGLFLDDIKKLIYGLFLTLVLSFIISVFFGFIYVWFFLGYSGIFSEIPHGWEWVIYMSFLNCFRMYVPAAITMLIFGASVGSLTSSYILKRH